MTIGSDSRLSFEEILTGDADETDGTVDLLAGFPEVTPRALAILSLCDTVEQLDRWEVEPLRLVLAAKSSHLALQAALTDALAGSDGTGAFDLKLKAEYFAYFEKSREGDPAAPLSDRVMSFGDLLKRAVEHPMEWSRRTLEVSLEEADLLNRLTFVRHRVEHVRPGSFFIEPFFIAQTLPVSARLTQELLDVAGHHYEDGERDAVCNAVMVINARCSQIHPPFLHPPN